MRKLVLVAVALAGLSMSQVASAVSQVWFTATGNNAQSTVGASGPGLPLNLTCTNAAPVVCSWAVTMHMNAPAADAGITAWSNDFTSPTAGMAISNLVVNSVPFPFLPANGAPGAGQNLWVGATAGSISGVEGGDVVLATFTLTKNKTTTAPEAWGVFTTVGGNEWGCNSGDASGGAVCDANSSYPNVQFGANVPVSAQGGTVLPLPVIAGVNVPEPATLSLVALGLLGLIRRRR